MLKEVIEYTICSGESTVKLARSVMLAILDGWQPHGSMVVAAVPPAIFHQPMVRLLKDEDTGGGE